MIACLAHNLLRWTELLGLPGGVVRAARSVRRRLLALPGRLTTHAGRWTLHLPARWPWQTDFTEALTRIRALPRRLNRDRGSPHQQADRDAHRARSPLPAKAAQAAPRNHTATTHAAIPRTRHRTTASNNNTSRDQPAAEHRAVD